MKLTGKPSIDKPWLQFYPEQLRNVEVPKMTIEEFLKYKNIVHISRILDGKANGQKMELFREQAERQNVWKQSK